MKLAISFILAAMFAFSAAVLVTMRVADAFDENDGPSDLPLIEESFPEPDEELSLDDELSLDGDGILEPEWELEASPIDDDDDLFAMPQVEIEPIDPDTLDDGKLSGSNRGALQGLESRGAAARLRLAREGGASKASEAAVDRALEWLASHQNPDGSWSYDHRRGPCKNRCPNEGIMADARMAATGMALLPFLGRGETHLEGRYKLTVKNGLAYLLRNMKVVGDRGDFAEKGATQYGHGICTAALCEAYAMTNDRALMAPSQMAVNQIVFNQDPVGGGWRYNAKQAGDTSVTGWQLMALKRGHQAFLTVPPATIAGASKFLDSVQAEEGSRYGYTAPGNGPSTTAEGLLCRMVLGWKRDREPLQQGVAFLGERGPSETDMYFNYYATQVMRHYDGAGWKKWNETLRDQLVESQSNDGHGAGSWFFAGNDHGAARGGRLYATCMATLILEVYYRDVPLYPQRDDVEFPLD